MWKQTEITGGVRLKNGTIKIPVVKFLGNKKFYIKANLYSKKLTPDRIEFLSVKRLWLAAILVAVEDAKITLDQIFGLETNTANYNILIKEQRLASRWIHCIGEHEAQFDDVCSSIGIDSLAVVKLTPMPLTNAQAIASVDKHLKGNYTESHVRKLKNIAAILKGHPKNSDYLRGLIRDAELDQAEAV